MTTMPTFLAPKPVVLIHHYLHENLDLGISASRWVASHVGPFGPVIIADAVAPSDDGGRCVGPDSAFGPVYLDIFGTADIDVRVTTRAG